MRSAGLRGDDPRPPLYNVEAEQALLGAILVDNRAFDRASRIIEAGHFGNAVHGRIFDAAGRLIADKQIANPITLKGAFDRDDALAEIGGARYLAQLAAAAVTVINAEHYARVVHEMAVRRRLVSIAEDLAEQASEVDFEHDAGGIIDEVWQRVQRERQYWQRSNGRDLDGLCLSVAAWLHRDLSAPDFLLGELLSATSRAMLIAPTGLGKTNFSFALAFAIAAGRDFLHWRCQRPARVLLIDGEMSRRLVKTRVADASRRAGAEPDGLFVLCRDDVERMEPLNTEAGQAFVDHVIEATGAEFVIFDNVASLIAGDMREEDGWAETLPWIRGLTRRGIGQLWIHHTGHDESHGYGTKTREWHLDTVALLERVDRPHADICFQITFSKARERAPHNRSDFDPAIITLADDQWTSERGDSASRRKKPKAADRALELLADAIVRDGEVPLPNAHIPPETRCVTERLWADYCAQGCISEGSPEAAKVAFKRAAKTLTSAGLVGKWGDWVWIVRRG